MGVVFGDVYGLFWVFELDLWKNGQMRKIWARKEAWDQPQVRRGVAMLRHSEGLRRVATVHSMEISAFCFDLLLHCFKDLSIGLMRDL